MPLETCLKAKPAGTAPPRIQWSQALIKYDGSLGLCGASHISETGIPLLGNTSHPAYDPGVTPWNRTAYTDVKSARIATGRRHQYLGGIANSARRRKYIGNPACNKVSVPVGAQFDRGLRSVLSSESPESASGRTVANNYECRTMRGPALVPKPKPTHDRGPG